DVVSNRRLKHRQRHRSSHEFDGDPYLQLVVGEADVAGDNLLLLISHAASSYPGCPRLRRANRDLHAALDSRLRDAVPNASGLPHALHDTIQDRGRDDGPDIPELRGLVRSEL